MRSLLLSLILASAAAAGARADVITFFDFNDSDLAADRGRPASITTSFASTGFAAGTGLGADPDGPGPEPASAAGQALNLSGSANNGRHVEFAVSTAGLGSIRVSFAAQRSSTGFNQNELLFSIDGGASFVSAGFFSPPTTFGLFAFDLGGFTALDDRPSAVFRVVFNGASGATGTNRLDNLAVTGTPVPEPLSLMLLGSGLAGTAWRMRRRAATERRRAVR